MEEQIMSFEIEGDAPADWQSNVILVHDGRGRTFAMDIPDDTGEVTVDVAND